MAELSLPIHWAATRGDVAALRRELDNGVSPDMETLNDAVEASVLAVGGAPLIQHVTFYSPSRRWREGRARPRRRRDAAGGRRLGKRKPYEPG